MQSSDALRELHHHDRRLDFIDRRLAALPAALAALDAEAASHSEAGRRREQEAAELAEALRRLERESAVLRGELTRLNAQQGAVTGMEALKASESQIRHCEERLASVEETLLVKLEAQEIHAREAQLRAGREAQQASALAAERQALIDEQSECAGERTESLALRQALLDDLPPADARLYLRIFSSHGHRSLAALRGGSCGGCGAALPPQELMEVRESQRVLPCHGCGRLILRVEEE